MLEVNNLNKSYNSHQALNGVSFKLEKGQFYGLLGPNGAGKTTTISIISTLISPDNGYVAINGIKISDNVQASKQLIGLVPQEIALYQELTAWDNLMFWGSLYEIPKAELKLRADEILTLFGLSDRKNEKIKNYSGGMKRRINIASALLHRPELLILDEPTVGIDPQSRNLIFEVLQRLHKQGLTILYTTHYMEEAEKLCDKVGIIDHGKLLMEGSVEALRKQSGMNECIITEFSNLTTDGIESLKKVYNIELLEEGKLKLVMNSPEISMGKWVGYCQDNGLDISALEVQKVTLESVFLHLTGKALRD